MTAKFKIGDVVLLAHPDTKYGFHGIFRRFCDNPTVFRVENIAPDGYYYITDNTDWFGAYEEMLEPAGGPW